MTTDEPESNAPDLPEVSRRRAALVNAIFSYVGFALTVVQGILLVPMYIRYIPVPLYGAWLATGNVLAWLELVDPGLAIVLQQRLAFAYGGKQREAMGAIIGTGVTIAASLSVIPLLAWPMASRLGPWLKLDPAFTRELTFAFQLGLLGTAITLAAYAFIAANTALQLATSAGLFSVVPSAVGIVATIVFLRSGFGLASIPGGLLVRGALLALLNGLRLAVWSRKHLRGHLRYSRDEARAIGRLLALTFNLRLGTVLLERVDAFLSARLISPTAAARLTLTGRSSEVARTAVGRIAPALGPGLAHLAGEGRSERLASVYGALGRYHGWVTAICIGSVVALNEAFVALWVGPELFGGQAVTALQAVSSGLWILTGAMYQVVIASGHIRAISFLALAEAAVRLPLQIVLIRTLGLVGVPLASCLSLALITGSYMLWFSARTYDVGEERPSREWLRAGALLTIVAGVGAALHAIPQLRALVTTWPRFALACVLVATMLTALVMALDPRARDMVTQVRARLRRRRASG